MIASSEPRIHPAIVLFVGFLAVSSSAIFIRFAQEEAVPSLVIAAWRTGLATLFLLPFALIRRRRELASMSAADWRLALASGVMLGIHFGSWISSLAFTSVVSSTVLVTTSPLWVGLASPFFLKEPLTRSLKIGIGLALLGSVVIAVGDVMGVENGRVFLNTTPINGQNPLLGNGLALIGALTAAVYLLIGRFLRPRFSLLSYTTVVYGAAALFLLIVVLLTGHKMTGYSPLAYLLLLLMAVFPQLIGHTSFNWALGFLPAAYVSVTVISEPIGATVLALIIFGEIPTLITILGSILILGGIFLASRPR